MAEKRVVVQSRAVAYKAGTDQTLPAIAASMNWAGSGWTVIDDLLETQDIVLNFASSMKLVKPHGTKRPIQQVVGGNAGLQSVTFGRYSNQEDVFELAIPDAQVVANQVVGGGAVSYITFAVEDEQGVWVAKRLSPTGNLAMAWKDDDFTGVPYEFTAFEDPDATTPGEPNWYYVDKES